MSCGLMGNLSTAVRDASITINDLAVSGVMLYCGLNAIKTP
jgi:hypothetical protein